MLDLNTGPATALPHSPRQEGKQSHPENKDNQPFPMRVTDFLAAATATFIGKNADYGNSWKRTGKVLNALLPRNFQFGASATVRTSQLIYLGLLIRLLDKISRGANLIFSGQAGQVIDESIEDTFQDAAAYCAMTGEVGKESL